MNRKVTIPEDISVTPEEKPLRICRTRILKSGLKRLKLKTPFPLRKWCRYRIITVAWERLVAKAAP